jgi:hypothetical protein
MSECFVVFVARGEMEREGEEDERDWMPRTDRSGDRDQVTCEAQVGSS